MLSKDRVLSRIALDLSVSRETLDALEVYADLLAKWTAKINLISKHTVKDLWNRHILDSAQIYHLAGRDWQSWVDLGSGGGLPGLIIAILARDDPEKHITLVDSDQRKAAFLTTVSRQLSLNTTIQAERIETISLAQPQILSARALSPLATLLEYADSTRALPCRCLFSKGRNWRDEVQSARENWVFELETMTSWTDPDAVILDLKEIERA